MTRAGGGRRAAMLGAGTAALLLLAPAATAEDPRLSVEQVPEDRALRKDARDEGLFEDPIPERCRDPEVAASDPACVEALRRRRNGERANIPIIEVPGTDDGTQVVPGVTVNQPRPPRVPR